MSTIDELHEYFVKWSSIYPSFEVSENVGSFYIYHSDDRGETFTSPFIEVDEPKPGYIEMSVSRRSGGPERPVEKSIMSARYKSKIIAKIKEWIYKYMQ